MSFNPLRVPPVSLQVLHPSPALTDMGGNQHGASCSHFGSESTIFLGSWVLSSPNTGVVSSRHPAFYTRYPHSLSYPCQKPKSGKTAKKSVRGEKFSLFQLPLLSYIYGLYCQFVPRVKEGTAGRMTGFLARKEAENQGPSLESQAPPCMVLIE